MTDTIIDFHCHPLVPAVVRVLDPQEFGTMAMPSWSIEEQLAMMDRHGIEVSMLSVNGVAETMVGAAGRASARMINESLAQIVAKHPTRFGAFATVPMDDMDAANNEMTYALDVLKLDGVGVVTQCRGRYLGEADYDPWLQEMDRRGVTLFVHPAVPPNFEPSRTRTNVSVLEFMFESTRMVTTMVLSGAKKRFDKIAVISTHGGGTVPYLAQRISMAGSMAWAYRNGPTMSLNAIQEALASFYFDLTAATSATSLDALSALVPADQLVMGFDYPLMPEETIGPAIAGLDQYSGFDPGEKRKVKQCNAANLIPRLASRP